MKETERETLGGVVEKEGGLRGAALNVPFKYKKLKLINMCQMYKREDGVNHDEADGADMILLFFVLYLYRRAHKTREHVFHCCRGMCAAIIQK